MYLPLLRVSPCPHTEDTGPGVHKAPGSLLSSPHKQALSEGFPSASSCAINQPRRITGSYWKGPMYPLLFPLAPPALAGNSPGPGGPCWGGDMGRELQAHFCTAPGQDPGRTQAVRARSLSTL